MKWNEFSDTIEECTLSLHGVANIIALVSTSTHVMKVLSDADAGCLEFSINLLHETIDKLDSLAVELMTDREGGAADGIREESKNLD